MRPAIPGLSLAELLRLERTSDDMLCSVHMEENSRGDVFGGLPLGQALAAATGLPTEFTASHLHVNFLSPGHSDSTVRYDDKVQHGGRSFAVRHVLGIG